MMIREGFAALQAPRGWSLPRRRSMQVPRQWAEVAVGLAVGWLTLGHDRDLGTMVLAGLVALAAARFGYGTGLVTGLAAGALVVAATGADPLAVLGQLEAPRALNEALGLGLLGALVGLAGDAHHAATAKEAAERARLENEHVELAARCRVLLAEKEAADRRLARQVLPLEALERELASLDGLGAVAQVSGALMTLGRFTGAEHLALYTAHGDGYRLAGAWGDRPGRPVVLPASAVRAAGGGVWTARTAEEAALGVMGAALSAPGGERVGLLVVEQLGFSAAHAGTAQMVGRVAAFLAAVSPAPARQVA